MWNRSDEREWSNAKRLFGIIIKRYLNRMDDPSGAVLTSDIRKIVDGMQDIPYQSQTEPEPIVLLCPSPSNEVDSQCEIVCCGNAIAGPQGNANRYMASDPVAISFTACSTSCISFLRLWFRWSASSAHSIGNNWSYSIEIQRDNNGEPDGIAIDTATYGTPANPIDSANNPQQTPTVNFNNTACFEEGEKGWLVITNTNPNPDLNAMSFNGPYLRNVDGPPLLNEALPKDNCGGGRVQTDGQWQLATEDSDPNFVYMPFFCASFQDGCTAGQPFNYGNATTSEEIISGTTKVRQCMTFDKPIENGKLYFYAQNRSGNEPLVVSVNGVQAGSLSGIVQQDASQTHNDARYYEWYSVQMPMDIPAGQITYIEFETGPNSVYQVSALSNAPFCDLNGYTGRAEVSTDNGASWSGWQIFANTDVDNIQLSLYVESKVCE